MNAPSERAAEGLSALIDASPSPYHAVRTVAQRLEDAGYRRYREAEHWALGAQGHGYVIRDGGSLIAWRVGSAGPAEAGYRILGAHTDSPSLAVRARPDVRDHGWRRLSVEPYGSPLSYTWLDRDLTVAGRVALTRQGSTASADASDHSPADDGPVDVRCVRLPGAPLRIPSLAVHLQRELPREGLRLDPQRHLLPVWGDDHGDRPGLLAALATELDVPVAAIGGYDLVLADTASPGRGGDADAYLFAPRLDNLVGCWAALEALLNAPPTRATQMIALFDHEEVGSHSAEGARGSFLDDVLARLGAALDGQPQAGRRARARSLLVSVDAAHALHPNHAERHDPLHAPRLGAGVVIKRNAGQAYATDAVSHAWFAGACADAGIAVQHFASRADLPCGSTIGPAIAARTGIAVVDVGPPLLSMHSVREQIAVADLAPLAGALTACLSSAPVAADTA